MKKKQIIPIVLMITSLFQVSGCATTATPSRNTDCSYKSNPKTEGAEEIIHRTIKQGVAIERGECD